MTKPRDPAIANLENQVEGDIKNASRVAKDIFKAVIGISNVGKPEVEPSREPRAKLEDDGRTITVEGSSSSSTPTSLRSGVRGDADSCLTCGGKGLVGRPGHEVTCPICGGISCKTCGGSGKVGRAGHEVDCPSCRS